MLPEQAEIPRQRSAGGLDISRGLAVTDRYTRDVAPADLIALGKSRTRTENA